MLSKWRGHYSKSTRISPLLITDAKGLITIGNPIRSVGSSYIEGLLFTAVDLILYRWSSDFEMLHSSLIPTNDNLR